MDLQSSVAYLKNVLNTSKNQPRSIYKNFQKKKPEKLSTQHHAIVDSQ
uniref:Uncharacterized protein n=1 Tax=Anguilla anguilla TaxID=7936 RepID=A0A0E9T8V9_ANGAN